ncbi:MAG: hypothetical protein KKD39_01660 [Candidatus Altiarchaeota archaeon]|nr:hypothetical protein [Candidatus Altiarchaeota archaeon]
MRVMKSVTGFTIVVMGVLVWVLGYFFPYLPDTFLPKASSINVVMVGKQLSETGIIIILAGIVSEMVIAFLRNMRIIH